MGPIETELRWCGGTVRHLGERAAFMPYVFFSGIACWALSGPAAGLLWGCSRSLALTIHDEESWSEAIEAAEALGL